MTRATGSSRFGTKRNQPKTLYIRLLPIPLNVQVFKAPPRPFLRQRPHSSRDIRHKATESPKSPKYFDTNFGGLTCLQVGLRLHLQLRLPRPEKKQAVQGDHRPRALQPELGHRPVGGPAPSLLQHALLPRPAQREAIPGQVR